MHLFIIGAPASGKMTIGQELSRLTDATLFYNHQAIDFALEIYQDYTSICRFKGLYFNRFSV